MATILTFLLLLVGPAFALKPPPPPPPPTKSTTTSTITSTTTSMTTSTTTYYPPIYAPEWGQCGGIGWSGPTVCVPGTTCVYLNDWHSQCLAPTTTPTPTATTTA